MTVEDYDNIIKRYKDEYGQLDMLVVDGLSMMGGKGSETELYTTNSGELKDLAKDHNIYIPLICHLSKGATETTRDTRRFVRGSEKILDNVDFVIMMSLISDDMDGFISNKGYARMYNKRGSGNFISKIYDFNDVNLLMTEIEEDPKMYDSSKSQPFGN